MSDQASPSTPARAGWLRFSRAGVRYRLRAERVRGLEGPRPVTVMPGAPAHVRGLVSWRGAVLALIEPSELGADAEAMRARLRSTPRALVVSSAPGGVVALAVDEVAGWVNDDEALAEGEHEVELRVLEAALREP